jgi:hypothetical protein
VPAQKSSKNPSPLSVEQLDADDAVEGGVEPPPLEANDASRNAAGASKSSQVYVSVFTVGMASDGNSNDVGECAATGGSAGAGGHASGGGDGAETAAVARPRRFLSLVFQ